MLQEKQHFYRISCDIELLFCVFFGVFFAHWQMQMTVLGLRWKQRWWWEHGGLHWHQSHTSPLSLLWLTRRSGVRPPVTEFVIGSQVWVKKLSSYLSGLWFYWLHDQYEIGMAPWPVRDWTGSVTLRFSHWQTAFSVAQYRKLFKLAQNCTLHFYSCCFVLWFCCLATTMLEKSLTHLT